MQGLPSSALLCSGCGSPLPHNEAPRCLPLGANFQSPPVSGGRQKLIWRRNCFAWAGKLFHWLCCFNLFLWATWSAELFIWPTIRAGGGPAGSLLVWAEGFTGFCQLPSPWQISLRADPDQGITERAAGSSPQEVWQQLLPEHALRWSQASASPSAPGRPCVLTADGWERCPCLPKL